MLAYNHDHQFPRRSGPPGPILTCQISVHLFALLQITFISREICYFASGSSSQSLNHSITNTSNTTSTSQTSTGFISSNHSSCSSASCTGCSKCSGSSISNSLEATTFLQLPIDLLLDILRSKDLPPDSEAQVVQAVVEWVAVDITGRGPETAALLQAVQLRSRAQLLQLQLQCSTQVGRSSLYR